MRKTWSPAGPLRRALTGIATTVVEGPVGTSTRTEAPGAGAWLWIRARTSALRVAGSTRASTATIRAVIGRGSSAARSEEHTSELQSLRHLVCRLLLEKKKKKQKNTLTYQNSRT